MAKPYVSPTLESAIEGFWDALHAAYPQIETEGVRPKQPGLFVGEIAGHPARLIPRLGAPYLNLMSHPGAPGYARFSFTKFKRGVRYRFGDSTHETILIVWLTNAIKELRAMAPP
jgi:hypothetical protein